MGCSIPQSGYNGGNLPLGQAFRAQLFRLAKTQRGRHPSFLHKLSQAILLTLTPSKHQLLTIMQCISAGFNVFADGSVIFSFAASGSASNTTPVASRDHFNDAAKCNRS